jgi:hypothetical protein
MRLDTSVGTFLKPPFKVLGSRASKRWSEEGTHSGIEEPHMLLAQLHNTNANIYEHMINNTRTSTKV